MPRVGVQLAYPYTVKRMEKWFNDVPSVFVQKKLNGVRARWEGDVLYTSEGNIQESVPHIEDQLWEYFRGMNLDGELYRHGWSLQQIRSVTGRSVNIHEDYDQIKFHVFDIIDTETPQYKRYQKLIQNSMLQSFMVCPALERVPANLVSSTKEIAEYTNAFVTDGYEGSIVRHPLAVYRPKRSVYMVKWKPHRKDNYKLVRMLEGKGKYEGTLGAMVVTDGDNEFHVGSFAITDGERDRLWKNRGRLEGDAVVEIRYTELSDDGIPPSSVFRTIVKGKV